VGGKPFGEPGRNRAISHRLDERQTRQLMTERRSELGRLDRTRTERENDQLELGVAGTRNVRRERSVLRRQSGHLVLPRNSNFHAIEGGLGEGLGELGPDVVGLGKERRYPVTC
jgi:hypothetical protein